MVEESKVIYKSKPFVLGVCNCGVCKQEIPIKNKLRNLQRYKHGHNHRSFMNPRWNGGKYIDDYGYKHITMPNDYHFRTVRGYVREHRFVYEQYYNCCLLPWTLIHHKDGNKQNNNIENLEPMFRGTHKSHHIKEMKRDNNGRFIKK